MHILKHYFFGEIFLNFLLTSFVLVLVLLMGNSVKIINHGISPFFMLRLIPFLIPAAMLFAVPMACLIGNLLTYGRLSSENEIIAALSSGISLKSLAGPAFFLGFLGTLSSLAINQWIFPKSIDYFEKKKKALVAEIIQNKLKRGTTFVRAGGYRFYQFKDRNGRRPILISKNTDEESRIIYAKDFRLEEDKASHKIICVLSSVSMTEFRDGRTYYIPNSEEMSISLPVVEEEKALSRANKKVIHLSLIELFLEYVSSDNSDRRLKSLITLQEKTALSIGSLFFAFVGMIIGVRIKNSSRLACGLTGIAVTFVVYYPLMIAGKTLALKEIINPVFGAWIPVVAIAAIGIFMYRGALQPR